jgi:hypothetical protein
VFDWGQIKPGDDIHHESGEMAFGQPVFYGRRHEKKGLTITIFEPWLHRNLPLVNFDSDEINPLTLQNNTIEIRRKKQEKTVRKSIH